MANIKVKFKASSKDGCEGRIYYQISHERKTRQIVTDYRILSEEWDNASSEIVCGYKFERSGHITSVREGMKVDLNRFERIRRNLEKSGSAYTTDDIISEFRKNGSNASLFSELDKNIQRLRTQGRLRTAQAYSSAMRSFSRFRDEMDIYLESVTPEVMEEYQSWLYEQGVSPNTVSFYMRIFRAVYNRAVDEELTENRRPFRHVYTGIEKTVKRGLPLGAVRKIKNLDLTTKRDLEYARDMFILSFMLRGMSFIDMSYLKKSDLSNGYVTYRRRKTRQQLTIEWTDEMQKIIDKYPENKSVYLLPIIRRPGRKERYVCKNVGEVINKRLKKVAELAGVTVPLTMYVARHSWASIAKAKGIPIGLISEGLGHEKESTTRIYLSSLDSSAVDNANSMLIKLL